MFHVNLKDKNIAFGFHHERYKYLTFSKGGGYPITATTYCDMLINGQEVCEEAECSYMDNFDKEIGRKIALERTLRQATKEFNLTKEDRREVWRAYFHRGKR